MTAGAAYVFPPKKPMLRCVVIEGVATREEETMRAAEKAVTLVVLARADARRRRDCLEAGMIS